MERVIAVGVQSHSDDPYQIEKMEEFTSLLEAAGAEVVLIVEQNLKQKNPATVIGSGKVEEIKELVEIHEIDAVSFNMELTGSQIRNLEKILDCKVIDRTNVILDIFAQRATEREGKLQVKLAQLSYRLPRLVGYRNYLSRTGGGIGTRGPGEQQLDTDRRHIEREMQQIRTALENTEQTRRMKSERRRRSNLPIVALLGYTNAGKSTLLNGLLEYGGKTEEKKVAAKDRLFETLSPAHRRSILPGGSEYLLMDTVGFVSDLPTEFVAAFQSTLEEVMDADLIVHVIDGSSKTVEIQIRTTIEMLKRLDALQIPRITAINKMDLVGEEEIPITDQRLPEKMWISAVDPVEVERVCRKIEEMLYPGGPVEWFVPYGKESAYQSKFSYIQPNSVSYTENGAQYVAYLRESDANRIRAWLQAEGI